MRRTLHGSSREGDGVEPRSAVRVRVPAKVNLFLSVRGLRPDGYHEMVTVLQTVDLHDELTCTLHGSPWARAHPAARQLMDLVLSTDAGPEVPVDGSNLVLRAAAALLQRLGIAVGDRDAPAAARPCTRLHLRKGIPVAAGMAGGSADAAATLVALDRLWEVGLDRDVLTELAAGLGADVPFCLHGGTALATGTGTDTVRVLARGEFSWVVCEARGPGLSTPDVFAAHDVLDAAGNARGQHDPAEPDLVLQALRTGDVELLAEGLHNDLQAAAVSLRPELADGLEALRGAGAVAALVSGSGPTLLGLARDPEHARAVAEGLEGRFRRVHVARSAAGGPRVVQAPAGIASQAPR